jgi:hypothetical protein
MRGAGQLVRGFSLNFPTLPGYEAVPLLPPYFIMNYDLTPSEIFASLEEI